MSYRTAPAKINWFLYVLRRREDGYHDILSAMQKLSLHDRLEFRTSASVTLAGNRQIRDNIVLKAVAALGRKKDLKGRGVAVTLDKKIPIAAGLGGGSSDAAAALIALNEFWRLGLPQDELFSAAAEVGSDVPFFLGDGFAVVKGRGEIIVPCRVTRAYPILLVNPGIGVSSRWAYENNRRFRAVNDEDALAYRFVDALNKADFGVLNDIMHNSLEEVVCKAHPRVRDIKEELVRKGAALSLMSGSGSTVFGVFETKAQAEKASKAFGKLWTCVTETVV